MTSPRPPWWVPWRRWPRAAVAAEIVVIGLVGAWLGLLAAGRTDVTVGPVQTEMSVSPSLSFSGGSVVAVPPLGELGMATHRGPLRLEAKVTRLRVADARRIFSNPATLNGLPEQVSADVESGVRRLAVRSLLASLAGACMLGVLVFRRRLRRIGLALAVALATMTGGGMAAASTWKPEAVTEPTYTGLLTSAPALVGDARSIVTDFQRYQAQLAKLVTNVSRLYDATSTLPAYNPGSDTLRVLFVSDLHLNPASWEIIRSITLQFDIDVVLDTGDISDHGSAAENTYVDGIATLGVPYVYVRGNHDSILTQRAVANQPNTTVLDDEVRTVVGLRIGGIGDPRFTPDKSIMEDPNSPEIEQTARSLATTARSQAPGRQPDIVMVHDPAMAETLDGTAPLILAGHYHRREQHELAGGSLLFMQGSTGASGLRGLEGDKPTPARASVLYLDRETHALRAWDDITLGGLGLTSAKIERRIYEKPLGEPSLPDPPAEDSVDHGSGQGRRGGEQPSPSGTEPQPDGGTGALWRSPEASPMLSWSPTAWTPWALRPHRLVAQDAALSRR